MYSSGNCMFQSACGFQSDNQESGTGQHGQTPSFWDVFFQDRLFIMFSPFLSPDLMRLLKFSAYDWDPISRGLHAHLLEVLVPHHQPQAHPWCLIRLLQLWKNAYHTESISLHSFKRECVSLNPLWKGICYIKSKLMSYCNAFNTMDLNMIDLNFSKLAKLFTPFWFEWAKNWAWFNSHPPIRYRLNHPPQPLFGRGFRASASCSNSSIRLSRWAILTKKSDYW